MTTILNIDYGKSKKSQWMQTISNIWGVF